MQRRSAGRPESDQVVLGAVPNCDGGESACADRGCLARAPRTRSRDGAPGVGSLRCTIRRRCAPYPLARDLVLLTRVAPRLVARLRSLLWLSLAGGAAAGAVVASATRARARCTRREVARGNWSWSCRSECRRLGTASARGSRLRRGNGVELAVERQRSLALGLGMDHRLESARVDLCAELIGVVTSVSDERVTVRVIEQLFGRIISWRSPGVRMTWSGLPFASTIAWILVEKPPRERPKAFCWIPVFRPTHPGERGPQNRRQSTPSRRCRFAARGRSAPSSPSVPNFETGCRRSSSFRTARAGRATGYRSSRGR